MKQELNLMISPDRLSSIVDMYVKMYEQARKYKNDYIEARDLKDEKKKSEAKSSAIVNLMKLKRFAETLKSIDIPSVINGTINQLRSDELDLKEYIKDGQEYNNVIKELPKLLGIEPAIINKED